FRGKTFINSFHWHIWKLRFKLLQKFKNGSFALRCRIVHLFGFSNKNEFYIFIFKIFLQIWNKITCWNSCQARGNYLHFICNRNARAFHAIIKCKDPRHILNFCKCKVYLAMLPKIGFKLLSLLKIIRNENLKRYYRKGLGRPEFINRRQYH